MATEVDRPRWTGAWRVWARVVGTALVGAIAGPTLAVLAFYGSWSLQGNEGATLPLVGLLAVAALLAASGFAGVEAATSEVRAAPGALLARALAVLVLGGAGWLAGAWVNAVLEEPLDTSSVAAAVLSGVPFALVAAVLMGGRPALVAAALAALGVVAAFLLVDAHERRGADDALLERFAQVRDLLYVVDVPGYPVQGRDGSGVVAQLDQHDPNVGVPGEVYGERTISLRAATGPFDCGATVLSAAIGRDEQPTCEQEAPGLWYRTGTVPTPEWGCPCGLQQYVRQDGATHVSVGATDAVPRATLRDAVLSARRASDDDLRRLFAAED